MNDTIRLDWRLAQLNRMAKYSPERMEAVLAQLFANCPELQAELAIGAVDQEMISIGEAQAITGQDQEVIESMLVDFRRSAAQRFAAVEVGPDRGRVARLKTTGVAVWEVVRHYRQTGSMDQIAEFFPDLTANEATAALIYAEDHREEIDEQIERYEQAVQRRLAEYPFS